MNKEKEMHDSTAIYLISMFIMPCITFIGFTLLNQEAIEFSFVSEVVDNSYKSIMFGEIVFFMISWVLLFISFIFYKFNIKYAQYILIFASFVFLVANVFFSLNTYKSIADIINPVIVLCASLFGILWPLPDVVTNDRKQRFKNTVKKYKLSKK